MESDLMITTRQKWLYLTAGLAFELLLMGPCPLQAQGDCKAILAEASKTVIAATHVYSTINANGNELTQEMIFLPGVYYWRAGNGKWSSEPVSAQEKAEMLKSKTWTDNVCKYVKDESVNGETAAVYSWHDAAKGGDTQVWISKAKGAPLRQEVESARHTRISMRFEYGSAKPPM